MNADGIPTGTEAAPEPRPFGRRLSHTPLRDALRGRFTGRLDIEWPIERAGLPPRAASVVREVVKQTRLSRGERADVARELAAHFRDALNAGTSEAQAIERFGDAATAARLIRRATKRKRPLAWKLWVRAWACAGVALLISSAYVGWRAAWYFLGEPTVSRNYLAEINAEVLKAPESERAWPAYRRALISLGHAGAPPLEWNDRDPDLWSLPPEHPMWVAVDLYLRAAGPMFTALEAAAKRPVMGAPMRVGIDPEIAVAAEGVSGRAACEGDFGPVATEDNPSLVSVLLSHLSLMRFASNVLSEIEAPAALRSADGARLERAVTAQLTMARHMCSCPSLIERLVGLSIVARASETLSRVVRTRPDMLDDAALARLAHGFSAVRVDRSLRFERLMAVDLVQRVFTDDGNGDGVLTRGIEAVGLSRQDEVVSGAIRRLTVSRREASQEIDRFYQDAQEHLLGVTPREQYRLRLRDQLDSKGGFRNPVLAESAIGVELVRESFDRGEMLRDASLIAIAAEIYRRRHGVFPEDANSLVPLLLPALPADLLSESQATLRIGVCAGEFTVYSVGYNGVDDGGVFRSVEPGTTKPPDLRLWPISD